MALSSSELFSEESIEEKEAFRCDEGSKDTFRDVYVDNEDKDWGWVREGLKKLYLNVFTKT